MSDVNVAGKRAGTILSDGIKKYLVFFCVVLMASVRELNCNTVYKGRLQNVGLHEKTECMEGNVAITTIREI
jgi:hypothetical protein